MLGAFGDDNSSGAFDVEAFTRLTWSEDKNSILKRQRGVAFEDVYLGIRSGDTIGVVFNHSPARHPGQDLLLVMIRGYVYAVPHERIGDIVRLITIYPDGERMTRLGLRGRR